MRKKGFVCLFVVVLVLLLTGANHTRNWGSRGDQKLRFNFGELMISEVTDNKTAESDSTGFLEIVNTTNEAVDIGGLILRKGTIVEDTFVPADPAVELTFPELTIIPARAYFLISNGAVETSFKSAWGISGDIDFIQGTNNLELTDGSSYELYDPETRGVLDGTPNVPQDSCLVQNSVGVWGNYTPEESTPAEIGPDQDDPLPVTFGTFAATQTAENEVRLSWYTLAETDMQGFRILRGQTHDPAASLLITPAMIQATNSPDGSLYQYFDPDVFTGETYWYWIESVELSGITTLNGPAMVTLTAGDGPGSVPPPETETRLLPNYPNPFNPSTTIAFELKQAGRVTMVVYNVRGQIVGNPIEDRFMGEGRHSVVWEANSDVSSQILFCRLQVGNTILVQPMSLLK